AMWCPLAAAGDPYPVGVVRKHLQHFPLMQALLHASPECCRQYFTVHLHEGGALTVAEGQEVDEGFREHVALANIEPRLAAHLVLEIGCFGYVAEPAIGDLTQLVIIIEDHAAMTGHSEVLQQEIAREDVCIRKVADALSIVEHRTLCGV